MLMPELAPSYGANIITKKKLNLKKKKKKKRKY
jgi:hypothetical protein